MRVRPVRRSILDGRERDVFLAEAERADRTGAHTNVIREAVYRQWLEQQFGAHGAARVVDARMTAFQLAELTLRTQVTEQSTAGRTKRSVCGPDATFEGDVQIGDPRAFADLVARGVGRHRAFGFGMLLLKPASASR